MNSTPLASPYMALELVYLHEVGRARDPVPTMLNALRHGIGLTVAADAPLVTADRTILEHLPRAAWD